MRLRGARWGPYFPTRGVGGGWGFRVWGLGVQGLGFRVCGLGYIVGLWHIQSVGFRVYGIYLGFEIPKRQPFAL